MGFTEPKKIEDGIFEAEYAARQAPPNFPTEDRKIVMSDATILAMARIMSAAKVPDEPMWLPVNSAKARAMGMESGGRYKTVENGDGTFHVERIG